MPKLNSLQDVFAEQIGDLRSAERQLLSALPKMQQAASSTDLVEAFESHLEDTREHVQRLEHIAGQVDFEIPDEECAAMKGLISEGEEIIEADGSADAKDQALIAAAQRVEHYEIAGYGTARALAERLDLSEQAHVLGETLDEESHANEKLTTIARSA